MMFLLVLLFFPVTSQFLAGAAETASPAVKPLQISCDSIPPLNREIMAFVNAKMGKKIGNGDCWAFPAAALNSVGASWDGRYKFGQPVNPETDCLYPGDIIQFQNVKVESVRDGGKFVEFMSPHTAIIYQVNAKGDYELAHQNYGYAGRKVGVTNLQLKNITRGKIFVYRPVK